MSDNAWYQGLALTWKYTSKQSYVQQQLTASLERICRQMVSMGDCAFRREGAQSGSPPPHELSASVEREAPVLASTLASVL